MLDARTTTSEEQTSLSLAVESVEVYAHYTTTISDWRADHVLVYARIFPGDAKRTPSICREMNVMAKHCAGDTRWYPATACRTSPTTRHESSPDFMRARYLAKMRRRLQQLPRILRGPSVERCCK